MPVFVCRHGESIEQPRAQAGFGVGGKSGDVLRDLIRRDKADAIHVFDDLIGVFFDSCEAQLAIDFEELVCLIDRNPVWFQRKQNIPHHAIFQIACEDHIPPLCADSGDFGETKRVFVENREGIHAKRRNDGARSRGANAFDESAAEIGFDGGKRRGCNGMVGDNLKLAAIFWMGCVFAFQLQPFANICQRKRADDGELFRFIRAKL